MQKPLLIFFSSLVSFSPAQKAAYDVIFASDYKNALTYIRQNNQLIKTSALAYHHSPELVTTIVFPELLRYSIISDILETTALEYIYLNHGSAFADFSIGRFQMKPSFVEQLETAIEASDSLKKLYTPVITYSTGNTYTRRVQRLQRLKTLQWQLVYLHAFISVTQEKFKGLDFEDTEDSLKFYATAYNAGFTRTTEQIKKSEGLPVFPYGSRYEGSQYAYADVALYYHDHVFVKKKLPKVPL